MIIARPFLVALPATRLVISTADPADYCTFSGHHYLPGHNPAARCYLGTVHNAPAAFISLLKAPGHPGWRVHRLVTLPPFRRLGIGNLMLDFAADLISPAPLYLRTRNIIFTASLLAADGSWRPSRHGRDATTPDRRTGSLGTVASTVVRAESVTRCIVCTSPFQASRSHATYCSDRCRAKAYRDRTRSSLSAIQADQ